MTKVRVAGFSISLDGFGAGPDQSLENPLGKRGLELHQWMFGTRMFRAMTGKDGGSDGVDDAYANRSMDGFGAFILGRNMFGPIRGPWADESWHPRPQYVRTDPRSLGGRELEGLVGRQPALSCADLRADESSARSDRDGRRHHLH